MLIRVSAAFRIWFYVTGHSHSLTRCSSVIGCNSPLSATATKPRYHSTNVAPSYPPISLWFTLTEGVVFCNHQRHSGKLLTMGFVRSSPALGHDHELCRSSRSLVKRSKSSFTYQLLISSRTSHAPPRTFSLRSISIMACWTFGLPGPRSDTNFRIV
jgi:hypothetical protein